MILNSKVKKRPRNFYGANGVWLGVFQTESVLVPPPLPHLENYDSFFFLPPFLLSKSKTMLDNLGNAEQKHVDKKEKRKRRNREANARSRKAKMGVRTHTAYRHSHALGGLWLAEYHWTLAFLIPTQNLSLTAFCNRLVSSCTLRGSRSTHSNMRLIANTINISHTTCIGSHIGLHPRTRLMLRTPTPTLQKLRGHIRR